MALVLPWRRGSINKREVPLAEEAGITTGRGPLGLLPEEVRHDALVVDRYIREGRFGRSLSLIAGLSSVLSGAEVLYEHYRGSYSQRIMYSPIILSPLLLLAGLAGTVSRRAARTVLPLISIVTILDGIVGFYFHVRGVHRRPGGWRVPVANVIMGPPVFAPLLFAISGYLGVVASLLRREDDPRWKLPSVTPRPRAPWLRWLPGGAAARMNEMEDDVREGRFQQGLAVAAAASASSAALKRSTRTIRITSATPRNGHLS